MTNVKIDRIILQNIEIVEIKDTEKLQSIGVLETAKQGCFYRTQSGQEFKKLTIENDGIISKFFASSKLLDGALVKFCHLTVLVRDKENTNLNCWSLEQHFDFLLKVQHHLEEYYGIVADFSDVAIKEIELNKTIELEQPFVAYVRPLQLMFANLPSIFQNTAVWSNTESSNTVPRTFSASTKRTNNSKRYMICSVYDKSFQLEQKLTVEQQLLRWEIRLVGAEKIKRALTTNKFAELTDDILNNFMEKQLEKLFVNPLKRWKADRDKIVSRLIVEERAKNKHWVVNVLRRLQDLEIANRKPFVLDISEVVEVFSNTSKDTTKRKNEIKSYFLKQAQKYERTMCQNDHFKIDEVLNKLAL